MRKQEIIDQLITNHQRFISYMLTLDDDAFSFSLNNDKWSAGQQMEHIYRSVYPLRLILRLPKWLIKILTQKANRPSKTFDELVRKYNERLQGGGRASGRFIPGEVKPSQKVIMKSKIEKSVKGLTNSLIKFSEAEIDKIVLPHPLLGRLTLREMMYFTIHHVEHHHQLTIQYLMSK